MSEKKEELTMTFDPHTIEHLGIKMYSTLPPVIAELISNAYDADASKVLIELKDNDIENKEIIITDNGHGMTFDEINNCFLLIGRNRRGADGQTQKTRSGKRFAIGKKGIGKLSFFGVAKTIEIETVSNRLLNKFLMDWDDLKNSTNVYNPTIIKYNEKTSAPDGTKIKLTRFSRKSKFQADNIAVRLAKTFSIFDKNKFDVVIQHNNEPLLQVENKLKFKDINAFYTWNFPLKNKEMSDYIYQDSVKGKIIASATTIPEEMRGIALFSRGKMVNQHSFFDIKATSFGYAYLTGWLDVDFIDEWEPDVISTNRQSLNWDDDRCVELKQYLESVITFVYNDRRSKIEEEKKKCVKDKTGTDIDSWINTLPKQEKSLANKLVKAVILNDGIENEKAADLVSYIQDSFQFTTFKEMAEEIGKDGSSDISLIELLRDWQIIEAREMYKLSEVRIQAIKKFQENIDNDAKEVPVMHNFLKQFPWLLDPRIMNFEDEVTYSRLLKEEFPDATDIPEIDRRLDFLCQNFAGNIFIIELKRPGKIIGIKELQQAMSYNTFLKKHLGNTVNYNISCYIIGKGISSDDTAQRIANSYENSNDVFIKTYKELLNAAIKYHQEFIEQYEKANKHKKRNN